MTDPKRIDGMGRSEIVAELERRRLDTERLDFLDGDWQALENIRRRGLASPERSLRFLVDDERQFAAEVAIRVDPRASMPEEERTNPVHQVIPPPPTGDTEMSAGVPAIPEHVIDALAWVLLRVGGWTHAKFSSHVRHEFGDEVGDELEAWLDEAGVSEAIRGIARTPANDSVSSWRILADPKRRQSASRQVAATGYTGPVCDCDFSCDCDTGRK